MTQQADFPQDAQLGGHSSALRLPAAPRAHGVASHPAPGREIAVIDAAVPDKATLIAGLRPGVELLELSPDSGGLREIADYLAATRAAGPVHALHVISHGAPGALILDGTALDRDSLLKHTGAMQFLRDALADRGALMLYGCEVAKGTSGQAFIASLAANLGVQVAASTTLTGAADRGGNWDLEIATGDIEAASPLSLSAMANFDGVLALNVGDFAVSRFDITNDIVEFVALTDVSPGETINLTDRGWISTNQFDTGSTPATALRPGWSEVR